MASQTPTSAQIAEHYDTLDDVYRAVWGEHVHHGFWVRGNETLREATDQLVAAVAAPLNLRAGERVCDIGCGYGATAQLLAKAFGVHVMGMTLSACQAASSDETPNVDLLYGDFLENTFNNAEFDAAVLIESIEHFPDSRPVMNELRRILRPGGRVAMTAWFAPHASSSIAKSLVFEPLERRTRIYGFTDERVLRADLELTGFTDIDVFDVTREVMPTWPHIAAGYGRALLTQPAAWRFILRRPRNASYALAVLRMMIAYRLCGLRYVIVSARTG